MNIEELKSLVLEGELGNVAYNRGAIVEKLQHSSSLYVDGGFSFYEAITTEHPLLVYRQAHTYLVRDKKGRGIPSTPDHLYRSFKTENVPQFIHEIVDATRKRMEQAPPGQCAWDLDVYEDAFELDIARGYCFKRECWLQAGNRESPGHVDHGLVLSYIPPCLTRTFKIWVAFTSFNAAKNFSFKSDSEAFNRMLLRDGTIVVVQKPGDVVYVSPLIYHSVLLGYTSGTPAMERWGIIDGYVFILREDKLHSYTYATQANTGARKGSDVAWTRVLGAYCQMEGRNLDISQISGEIKGFVRQVMIQNPDFEAKHKNGACTQSRSRKRKASIARARTFKKKFDQVQIMDLVQIP